MKSYNFFNPMKNYRGSEEIFHFLDGVIGMSKSKVCFYGDNTGYYFSPFRNRGVSICLTENKYYNLFSILKNDIYVAKVAYGKLAEAIDFRLVEYFEEMVFNEENVVVSSFALMCLFKLSNNTNDDLSDYSEDNMESLIEGIKSLDSYYLQENDLHIRDLPEDCFVISNELEFSGREGILLSKRKKEGLLVNKFEDTMVYYREA
jgi:hypothetical protein